MRGAFAASPLGFARGTRAELDVGREHVPGTRQFKKGRPRLGRYGAFGPLQGFQRKNPVVHGAFVQHVGARHSLRARLSAFQRWSRARVAFLTAVRCRSSPFRMTFVCPTAARFSSLSTALFRHSDLRCARRQAPATALRFRAIRAACPDRTSHGPGRAPRPHCRDIFARAPRNPRRTRTPLKKRFARGILPSAAARRSFLFGNCGSIEPKMLLDGVVDSEHPQLT